jgi:hypothetical protein
MQDCFLKGVNYILECIFSFLKGYCPKRVDLFCDDAEYLPNTLENN